MPGTGITNESYWTSRYAVGDIPWDTGSATQPITDYADQLKDKRLRILIPGAGNAHEAAYLWENGFRNVHVLDLSRVPLEKLLKRIPDFPSSQLIVGDFFDHSGTYDLIIEQTFFCALHPVQRSAYVTRMKELLRPDGVLAGVLFDDPLFSDHPPYGGNAEIYREFFTPEFRLNVLERCYNSIPPRAGRELWIHATPE